jgi:hypothetical protein
MSIILDIVIGDGETQPIETLEHYYDRSTFDPNSEDRNPVEYLKLAYIFAKEGHEKAKLYANQKSQTPETPETLLSESFWETRTVDT